jgi:hypothetical protein
MPDTYSHGWLSLNTETLALSVVPCSEWITNHHRDSIATHIGHHDQMAYFAVAQNDAVGRVRYQLLEVSKISLSTSLKITTTGDMWKPS